MGTGLFHSSSTKTKCVLPPSACRNHSNMLWSSTEVVESSERLLQLLSEDTESSSPLEGATLRIGRSFVLV